MKITKLDKTVEAKIGVKEVLSVIDNNRTRVRNLCNIIMTSCSLFLSSSFVVLFFFIKESYQNNSLVIALLLLSAVMLIVAIFLQFYPLI
jgi:membrane protein YdbS with pleckstrin-like domain